MSDAIDLAEVRAKREAAKAAQDGAARTNAYVPATLLANLIGALEAQFAYAKSLEAQIAVLAAHVAPDKAIFDDIISRLRQLEAATGRWPGPSTTRTPR